MPKQLTLVCCCTVATGILFGSGPLLASQLCRLMQGNLLLCGTDQGVFFSCCFIEGAYVLHSRLCCHTCCLLKLLLNLLFSKIMHSKWYFLSLHIALHILVIDYVLESYQGLAVQTAHLPPSYRKGCET